jgi:hypothetical protein
VIRQPTFNANGIFFVVSLCCWVVVNTAACIAQVEKANDLGAPFFESRILPILTTKCFSCHGPKVQESNFRLDLREIVLSGGDYGKPAIVAGDSSASPLYQFVSNHDSEMAMPPKQSQLPRLSAADVSAIRDWIDAGADWPDSANTKISDPLDWWSFKPLFKMSLRGTPALSRSANGIDSFIVAKLTASGLTLSPPADCQTLARRLYFDLIGLPPSREELEEFEREWRSNKELALDRLVDRLLAMPQYGERWARHWLDIVHYGDSHGYDKDKPRANAWPYRDYVIRALNQDKPYSRFVQEQIAGDVLWPGTRDGVEALGFIAAGPWDFIGHAEVAESKTDGKIARHMDRDDMVANTIGTFCSVTVHCAQCHQHKFDPISQEDYYRLHAVFSALDRTDRKYYASDADQKRFVELEQAQSQASAAIGKIATVTAPDKQSLERDRKTSLISKADLETQLQWQKWSAKLEEANQALQKLPPPSLAYVGSVHSGTGTFVGTGAMGGKPRPIHLLVRGQVTNPSVEIGPGAIQSLSFRQSEFTDVDSSEGSRRTALANWITDPSNPLTWRSIVNRVWQFHFGRGLVDTPNDFGHNGALPSHPELLDWLACEFRDGGGSLKRLHKCIVTSETYRQSSATNSAGESADASNFSLWRQNRKRLEAEAIRDSILSVSGQLDRSMGGPGWQDFVVEHPDHSPHYEYTLADPNDRKTWRRSVYRFIVRSQTQPWMTALDCADPSIRVDKRNESLSPIQALALLNNGFVLTQSKHFAERIECEAKELGAQVDLAFRFATGNNPSALERDQMVHFAQTNGMPYLCRLLFNLNAFSFVD